MARILLSTFGSFGDLFPYLALGTELRACGHHVTLATSAAYAHQVQAQGLAFHAVRPDVQLADRELLAYVMDARRGTERIVRYLASLARESYDDILPAAAEADLIVTHPIAFASVLAAQKLRKPWVSTVLAPMSFLSAHDPSVLAPAPWLHSLRFLGAGFTQAWIKLGKAQSARWIGPLLDLRDELGLQGQHPMFEGQHSPALVLALFSRVMAEPQADWPPQALTVGFPFFDSGELSSGLQQFLDAGPAPLVFTLGSSAVGAAGDFYRHSFAAARSLGVRAIFLTGAHPQGLPDTLPADMLAIPYAPHAPLFARASVIVHQGGVGTTAQALRAGRPQLVTPFAHDQFDNAERVRRLGGGEVLPSKRYRQHRAETLLRRLLDRPSYADAAARIAQLVRQEQGSAAAADAIERLLSQ